MLTSQQTLEVLEKLCVDGIAVFHDPSFGTLEEAVEYQMIFCELTKDEASNLIFSRNFCDLKTILELARHNLVELVDEDLKQITYRLTLKGVEYIRELKLKRILE